jgi:hypothetical protein
MNQLSMFVGPRGQRRWLPACALLALSILIGCVGSPDDVAETEGSTDEVAGTKGSHTDVDVPTEPKAYLKAERAMRAPRALTKTELDHLIELRAAYGLNTDPTFIRSLYENPIAHEAERSPVLLLGGILFTPEERAHAYRRVAAEWVGTKVDSASIENVAGYAGTVVNSDASLTVMCAGCDEATARAAVEARIDVAEPYEIRVKQVAYSTKELRDRAEAISKFLEDQGIDHGGAIDTATNSITIHLPDAAAELAETLGEGVNVELGYEEVAPDLNKNEPIAYLLVEGGQYITGPEGALTSGFAVQNGYGPFIVTAGHYAYPSVCTGTNGTWSQGGATLGIMTGACQYGGDMDASAITTYPYRNNWGRIHWTSTDWSLPVAFPVTTQDLVGQTVCQTGATTTGMTGDNALGTRCGTVSSTSSKSPCAAASPAWTFSLGAASYVRAGGDSGAGVVWPTIYGFGAAGTHSCQGFGGTGAIFSRYSVMASKWGLSLSPF